MSLGRTTTRHILALTCALSLTATGAHAQMQVIGTSPQRNVMAAVGSTVSITFDRPLQTSSVNAASFRVFGRSSGNVPGTRTFSNSNRTVTFTRSRAFQAGEIVSVTLSHDLRGADLVALRPAGYFYQFMAATAPATREFDPIAEMSNRIDNLQTRIYGANGVDLNQDGYVDLATVNEVSADVRVFMNLANGAGTFGPFLTPQPIGVEASPNESADFDNDGFIDLCVGATESDEVWVLMGNGDGTFGPLTGIDVGSWPHGVAPLDVDGDGDWDIVNANYGSDNLSLLINNGSGVFAAPVFLSSGVSGEWGLAAADMNDDGICDVVAGGTGGLVQTLLGNGNGTFTPAAVQNAGGYPWGVAIGDLNGDRVLDALLANSVADNGGVVFGNGDGTFDPPVTLNAVAHTPSADLGDFDGDGDLDVILSSFGAGLWRMYVNNGTGGFAFDQDFFAPSNPSCAVPLDIDNDRDLDLVLTDEIADVVLILENQGTTDVPPNLTSGGLQLRPNVPEPLGDAGTEIRFSVPRRGDVRIAVHDGAGRELSSVVQSDLAPGWHQYRLDGRDRSGRPLPAGVYFYVVSSGGWSASDRMVVIR
jgi:FG-GAP-like repeat/Bacterial Ig-like domain